MSEKRVGKNWCYRVVTIVKKLKIISLLKERQVTNISLIVSMTFLGPLLLMYGRQEKRLSIMFQPATAHHLLRRDVFQKSKIWFEKLNFVFHLVPGN